MPQSLERATVFEGAQVGVEATSGTAVAANKRLLCTSIENLSPDIPAEAFRTYGSKAASSVVTGKGMGAGTVNGALCPTDLSYLLSTALCVPTISTPGGGTLTRNWLFNPRNFQPDTFKTLTIDKGSFAGGERTTYAVMNGFNFNININEAIASFGGTLLSRTPTTSNVWPTGYEAYEITKSGTTTGGTFTLTFVAQTTTAIAYNATAATVQAALELLSSIGVGNVQVYGGPINTVPMQIVMGGTLFGTNPTDMTINDTAITGGGDYLLAALQQGSTITDLAAVPISSSSFDIYVATAYADLPTAWTTGSHTSQLLRSSSLSYDMPDRFNPGKFLDTTQPSYSALIEKDIEGARVNIAHMANAEGRAFLGHFTVGTRLWARALGLGPLIEGTLYYGIQITAAVEVLEYTQADNDGAYDANIVCQNVYDADLAGFLEVQLRSTLTAL